MNRKRNMFEKVWMLNDGFTMRDKLILLYFAFFYGSEPFSGFDSRAAVKKAWRTGVLDHYSSHLYPTETYVFSRQKPRPLTEKESGS